MTKAKYLYSLLCALPPDLKKIEEELKSKNYSSVDVTQAACEFCEECFGEYTDFINEHSREPYDYEIHTSYVYDICKSSEHVNSVYLSGNGPLVSVLTQALHSSVFPTPVGPRSITLLF